MRNSSSIPSRTITRKEPKLKESQILTIPTPKQKETSSSNTLFLIFLFVLLLVFSIQILFGNSYYRQDSSFDSRLSDNFRLLKKSSSITSVDEGDLKSDEEDMRQHFDRISELVKVSDLKRAGSKKDLPKSDGFNIDPDKEPVRLLLERAGVEVTPEIYSQLPSYSDITSMYGDKVKIYGLETCSTFQSTVPGSERMLAVAGMFNTGTNLLTELLYSNCYIEEKVKLLGYKYHGIRVQVPWGKHSPIYFRNNHKAKKGAVGVNHEYVLPAVMIKDPYTFMGSLCRHHYAALWKHTAKHCPNLVANDEDMFVENGKIIPAIVKYTPTNITRHSSLVGIWNDWYNNYIHYHHTSPFPRLIVRFEDILFRTKETVTQVCNCAGGKLYSDEKFIYIANSAKGSQPAHKGAQGLLQAVMFYGNVTNRYKGFTKQDLEYARRVLDHELMDVFGYSLI